MVICKANGAYIEDELGRKFIDTSMGSGAQIIGHNNSLIKKIKKQLKKGTIYTIPNIHTKKVNFHLNQYINPDLHDEYIFCNSGTEANMRAIRLARAYTKKDRIGKFHGGWHGGIDGFIESDGIPSALSDLTVTLPYNDDSALENITPDLAAVIIEPSQGSNPRIDIREFLHQVQEKCNKEGVLFILDEVMTGFRLGAQGGRDLFDLNPDIITYGKVLGGGFPIGAVGGRKDVMLTPNVFYGGTFSANPLTMYAAKLVLQAIKEQKHINYKKLNATADYFRLKLNHFFRTHNKNIHVMGCGPINRLIFTNRPIKNRKERDRFEEGDQKSFYKRLKENGVFVNSNRLIHISMPHIPLVKTLIRAIIKAAT